MQEKRTADFLRHTSYASFWINNASRELRRMQEARLRPLGFSMAHMPVLVALGDGSAKTQKQLAEFANVEQPSMAEMLSRSERDGVIQRNPNPEDRRSSLISLTRKTMNRLEKIRQTLTEQEAGMLQGFSAAEKAQLISLLQRAVANLDKADPAA